MTVVGKVQAFNHGIDATITTHLGAADQISSANTNAVQVHRLGEPARLLASTNFYRYFQDSVRLSSLSVDKYNSTILVHVQRCICMGHCPA
jgi:hypothetical protein